VAVPVAPSAIVAGAAAEAARGRLPHALFVGEHIMEEDIYYRSILCACMYLTYFLLAWLIVA